jgi:hypothetical protein
MKDIAGEADEQIRKEYSYPGLAEVADRLADYHPDIAEFLNSGIGVSNVSAYGTNQRDYLREDFWFIAVTEGNEDETEIADTSDRWGQGDQGHPPGNTQAILGRRKDPHCP